MRLEQRGLAHAVAAHEADHAARRHLERDIPEHLALAVGHVEAPRSQACGSHRARPRPARGRPPCTRSSCWTSSTGPSQSTLPSCSTVTVRAMLRTNSMSCSMTSTVRSPRDRLEQLPGPRRSPRRSCPATGSSTQEQLGVLDDAPCRSRATASRRGTGRPARCAALAGEPDRSRASPRCARAAPPSSRARSVASTPLLGRASDSSRFSQHASGCAKIDGRLELAADRRARRSRSRAGRSRSVCLPKITRPARRAGPCRR